MRKNSYSLTNPNNGNVTWDGPLSIQKGDHTHMPSRTAAYLPGDDRGHLNASSLGGDASRANIVPQHNDVDHGAYYSMEDGERTALQNGATINSTKTAVVDGQPGDRPNTFMVTDGITYADGHTETIYHSFTNESYADQQAWNDASAALPGTFDAPNPGDSLRESMSTAEYADLMEATDAELPGISEDYAAADFSGIPGVDSVAGDEPVAATGDDAVSAASADDSTGDTASISSGESGSSTSDTSTGASAGDSGGASCDDD